MNKCDICGKEAIEFEPRFLYWTCKEHSNVPPAYRYDFKQKYFSLSNPRLPTITMEDL